DPGLPPSDRVTTQSLNMNVCGQTADRVRQDGFVASVEQRVPSPGAYQVRVAMRNEEPEAQPEKIAVGAATQFLIVPDLRRSALALSGISVWTGDTPPAPTPDIAYRSARDRDPAVRRFTAGESVRYSFRVFGSPDEV